MPRADLTLVPDVEQELDELYGLPLGEFTAARDGLARRLRKAGRSADAERVAALRKPSVSAWAVNQLARRERDRVRELLDAGEALVRAQTQALAGKGAGRFDEAGRRQRDAIKALVRSATAALSEDGRRPSGAIEQRVAASLRAASVDPDGRSLLEQGRLEADFESAGLGLLAGVAPAPRERARAPDDLGRERRIREARTKLETAREEERRLAEEAAAAERDADAARQAADDAAARARMLAKQAARAAKAAEQAETALERLLR